MVDIGIFTTLNGPGSRALVTRVLAACRDGSIPGARAAFVLVDRGPGESDVTDAAVSVVARDFDVPILRVSAVRFMPEVRKAGRAAARAGDPAPMEAWREAWWASYRESVPPADIDLCLGDLWIWGATQCAERRGVNLHPALPGGPVGSLWYDVIWDLVAARAEESGAMFHRVIPEVDEGPVVSWCRYGLREGALAPLWDALPDGPEELAALVSAERAKRGDSDHPLFTAIRALGVARETPLALETVRAVAGGRLRLEPGGAGGVVDGAGRPLAGGLELTAEVERAV